MRKFIVLFVLMISVCSQIQAGDHEKRFFLRNSVSTLWNTGWENRFFYCWTWYEIRGDSLVFGPWNCFHVLQHTTIVNPELWWKVGSTRRVDFFVTLKYQYLSLRLRDSLTFGGFYDQEELEARLHFFSVGGRIQFKSLPLKPYLGENVGICRGSLTTTTFSAIVHSKKVSWYWLVDGSGGGVFVDVLVGAEQKLWRGVSFFGEWGYRFTPAWRDFTIGPVYGTEHWQANKFSISVNRNIRIKGPFVAVGIEVEL